MTMKLTRTVGRSSTYSASSGFSDRAEEIIPTFDRDLATVVEKLRLRVEEQREFLNHLGDRLGKKLEI